MEKIFEQLTVKKHKLDSFRPLSPELVKNLDDWFKVELTYSSNAIEGNTLSRIETALVVEKGLTVNGKTLKEHLEAINHAEALDFIRDLVGKDREQITLKDLLQIHWCILKGIDDGNAGKFRTINVKIAGVEVSLPPAFKVPELMENFFKWLRRKNSGHPVKIAADTHLRLVSIHPFIDGNGRTARLLLNLLLMQNGYPPALIRNEDRKAYIESIAKAQTKGDFEDYYRVIYKAVDRSLDIYLEVIEQKKSFKVSKKQKLLKIGELARETRETIHTLRFWTKEGLLKVADYTPGGYQLFDFSMIERVKEIRRLQKEKRLKIKEIKEKFDFL